MRRLLCLLLLACPLHAQWLKVASEGSTQALSPTVSLPAGATYRFGLAVCPATGEAAWGAFPATTSPTTMVVYYPSGQVGQGVDPCPGSVKELDVEANPAPQIVTVTTGTTTATLTIPGTIPPTSLSVTPGTVYTLTFSGLTPQQVTLAISNTVGSVPLICLSSYANGVLSLSCTVQASGQ